MEILHKPSSHWVNIKSVMTQGHIWVHVDPAATPRLFIIDGDILNSTIPRIGLFIQAWALDMQQALAEQFDGYGRGTLQNSLCSLFSYLRNYARTGELVMFKEEQKALEMVEAADVVRRRQLLRDWVYMVCDICDVLDHDNFLGCSDVLFEHMFGWFELLFAELDRSGMHEESRRLFLALTKIFRGTTQAYLDSLHVVWNGFSQEMRDCMLRMLRLERLTQGLEKALDQHHGDSSATAKQLQISAASTTSSMEAHAIKAGGSYRYSPLPKDSIRLLRLMPHRDKTAPIQCTLFDYPLLASDDDDHLYDALSYVWGSSEKTQSIAIDNYDLPITANLHAALSRLRHGLFERLIWVDAICINQEDLKERGHQVQTMAKIYASASRVVVWLGEAEADSEQALEEIHRAANGQSTKSDQRIQQAIIALLQRSWFKRVWVLQEVAAAQNVHIICGSAKIDGSVFYSGLSSLKLSYIDQPELQNLIRPAVYLIRRTMFWSKDMNSTPGSFSLNIRPLAELIDMYHIRKASDRRDKIYALLGMSSDNHSAGGLSADYEVSWKTLFRQVVKFILGEQVSVMTWNDEEVTVIKSKGCVLGKVSSVESYSPWDDRQKVYISFWRDTEYCKDCWVLPVSAKSIQKNDIVCLLQGASKPTIARLNEDYLDIISIAVTFPGEDEGTLKKFHEWLRYVRLKQHFPHEFLFVWDWDTPLGGQGRNNQYFINSRVPKDARTELGNHLDKAVWLVNMGLIVTDERDHGEGAAYFLKAIEAYGRECGDECSPTLIAINSLVPRYKKSDYRSAAHELKVITDLLGIGGHYEQIPRQDLIRLMSSSDMDIISILLDRRENKIEITKDMFVAAAGRSSDGVEIVKLLLDRRGNEIEITEDAFVAAAGNRSEGGEMMKILLEPRGNEVKITENVLVVAARNQARGQGIMALLLGRRGDEVKITEDVLEAAATNETRGLGIMKLLLDQGGTRSRSHRLWYEQQLGTSQEGWVS
ncbi:Heterokaryon incompatibility 6-like protein [Cladobotryum mycophilum]|uniref:Heterokaryon incompatibility 6-like protein n=1 Tax=Cladobotryum mycophilum TaxID=491253 RepID=A0ABR0SYZ9_9HYPO